VGVGRKGGIVGFGALAFVYAWLGTENPQAGGQHWWSKSLRSSATYGLVRLDSDFDLCPNPAGTYKQTQYASMNLAWSPWPPFDVGLEYMFGHRTVTNSTAVDGSTTGQNHRVQFSMRWILTGSGEK